jgi:hypothetical protein
MEPNAQEPGYSKEDISNKKIALYGVISIVLFVAIIFAVSQVFLDHDDSLIPKKNRPYIPLKELRAHEDSVIYAYKKLDIQKNIYQIPADSAINLIDQEIQNKTLALDPTKKK